MWIKFQVFSKFMVGCRAGLDGCKIVVVDLDTAISSIDCVQLDLVLRLIDCSLLRGERALVLP